MKMTDSKQNMTTPNDGTADSPREHHLTDSFSVRFTRGCMWSLLFLSIVKRFAYFTFLTPYVLDDYFALYKNPENVPLFQMRFVPEDRICSLADVVTSQIHLFYNWSGRIFFLFTIQLVSIFPKLLFDLLNGVAAALCLTLIVRHAAGMRKLRLSVCVILFCLFWLCCPSPGLTLLWMNGAVCYLWTAVFYLLLLYPFRMALEYGLGNVRHGWLWAVVTLLCGVVGCNANENTAGAVIMFSLVSLFLIWRTERKIPLWGVTGLFGELIGFSLLLFAPGLRVRVAAEGYAAPDIVNNFVIQTGHFLHTMPGLVPLCLFLAVLLFSVSGKSLFKTPAARVMGLYAVTGVAAAYAMVVSPYTPGRALFGCFIFLLCFAGKALQELLENASGKGAELRSTVVRLTRTAALSLCLMTVFSMAYAWRDISFSRNIMDSRENHVMRMMIPLEKRKNMDVVFRSMVGVSPYNALYKTDVLKSDPDAFVNRYYAHKWCVRSVRVSDEPDVTGMTSDIFPAGAAQNVPDPD